jgi:hypothetical protein
MPGCDLPARGIAENLRLRPGDTLKKQYTRWIWRYYGGKGTFIKIGWVFNKNKGNPHDTIRLWIRSLTGNWDFNIRIDEGLAIIAGLGKTLAVQSIAGRIGVIK